MSLLSVLQFVDILAGGCMVKKIIKQSKNNLEYLYATLSILIFCFGTYILTRFGWTIAVSYLVYCLVIEAYIFYFFYGASYNYGKKYALGSSYYFGKNSAFEKNMLGSKGYTDDEIKKQSNKNITFLNILPELLILTPPLLCGFHRLFIDFSWFCLGLITIFILLYLISKGVIWKTSIPNYTT